MNYIWITYELHMKHEWTDKMWNLPLSASQSCRCRDQTHNRWAPWQGGVSAPVPSIANRVLKKIWEKPRGNWEYMGIWSWDSNVLFDVTNYEHIIFMDVCETVGLPLKSPKNGNIGKQMIDRWMKRVLFPNITEIQMSPQEGRRSCESCSGKDGKAGSPKWPQIEWKTSHKFVVYTSRYFPHLKDVFFPWCVVEHCGTPSFTPGHVHFFHL